MRLWLGFCFVNRAWKWAYLTRGGLKSNQYDYLRPLFLKSSSIRVELHHSLSPASHVTPQITFWLWFFLIEKKPEEKEDEWPRNRNDTPRFVRFPIKLWCEWVGGHYLSLLGSPILPHRMIFHGDLLCLYFGLVRQTLPFPLPEIVSILLPQMLRVGWGKTRFIACGK